MNETSSSLEALRLISDWAKWLITIETGAIAIIGALLKTENVLSAESARVFATGAIISLSSPSLQRPYCSCRFQKSHKIFSLGRTFG